MHRMSYITSRDRRPFLQLIRDVRMFVDRCCMWQRTLSVPAPGSLACLRPMCVRLRCHSGILNTVCACLEQMNAEPTRDSLPTRSSVIMPGLITTDFKLHGPNVYLKDSHSRQHTPGARPL